MKKKLTQKRLKELLHYDPDTGIFIWENPNSRRLHPGDNAGGLDELGYIRIMVDRSPYKAHRLAWLYVYGYFPENDIDHIDRIRNHNWIDNLREVSRSCNIRNSGNSCTNTSSVKGVSWAKTRCRWVSTIGVPGRQAFIGYYKDFTEAVYARFAAEQCLGFGECNSLSPSAKYIERIVNSLTEV